MVENVTVDRRGDLILIRTWKDKQLVETLSVTMKYADKLVAHLEQEIQEYETSMANS